MLNLEELEQLVAYADCGTLSKAAEALHISQPTITRTMQSLEQTFGVSLFVRGKNKIKLNETGTLAVEYARKLLKEAEDAKKAVQDFDRSLHTIHVESCAPAPLWTYLPRLSQKYPTMTISSEMKDIQTIIEDVLAGNCKVGIIPYAVAYSGLDCQEYIAEQLSVCLPANHPLLAAHTYEITLSELNGYNCLLRSEIGFWEDLCHRKMPASRFLVQADDFEFIELTKNSTLPFFVTNLADYSEFDMANRIVVHVTDVEANVTYYIITRKGH